MRELDIQHPDITSAEATGYPRSRPSIPDRQTVEKEFIHETIEDFVQYCMRDKFIVEDYLAEKLIDYQDYQWERYSCVVY